MKKIIFSALAVSALLSLPSCSTTGRTARSASLENSTVLTYELRSNLEVDSPQKLKGQGRIAYLFGLKVYSDKNFAEGAAVSESGAVAPKAARSAALYNALNGTDYDMVVSPLYQTHVKNYFVYKKVTVGVTGYGAKTKTIKEIDPVTREVVGEIPLK